MTAWSRPFIRLRIEDILSIMSGLVREESRSISMPYSSFLGCDGGEDGRVGFRFKDGKKVTVKK